MYVNSGRSFIMAELSWWANKEQTLANIIQDY
jgi:hypothetical protein